MHSCGALRGLRIFSRNTVEFVDSPLADDATADSQPFGYKGEKRIHRSGAMVLGYVRVPPQSGSLDRLAVRRRSRPRRHR